MKTVNEMIYATIFNRNGTDAKKLEELGFDVKHDDDGRYSVNGWYYWRDTDPYHNNPKGNYFLVNEKYGMGCIEKRSRKDFRVVDFEKLLARVRKPFGTYMHSRMRWGRGPHGGESFEWWSRNDKLQDYYGRNAAVGTFLDHKEYLNGLERDVSWEKERVEEIKSSIEELQNKLIEAENNYKDAVEKLRKENPQSQCA